MDAEDIAWVHMFLAFVSIEILYRETTVIVLLDARHSILSSNGQSWWSQVRYPSFLRQSWLVITLKREEYGVPYHPGKSATFQLRSCLSKQKWSNRPITLQIVSFYVYKLLAQVWINHLENWQRNDPNKSKGAEQQMSGKSATAIV